MSNTQTILNQQNQKINSLIQKVKEQDELIKTLETQYNELVKIKDDLVDKVNKQNDKIENTIKKYEEEIKRLKGQN